MALTVSSFVFYCALDVAEQIAKLAGLRSVGTRDYLCWEDRQTGGGGCRIVWCAGVAWISRHSGYAWADMTEEVAYFFQEVFGCKSYDDPGQYLNPNIYGFDHWKCNESTGWERILPK
mgnify:CR=1 FL=1